MRLAHLLSALPLACLFANGAEAQEAACTKKLTMVNEIQMESKGPGPSTVPVEINGVKHNLTFATAGTATQITEDTAKALGLSVSGGGEIALFDSQGRASSNQVTVTKFTMGTLEGTNMKLAVSPGGGRFGGGGGGGAGLFSLNHMLPYDVDVDFGTDKLRFFDQDHCPGGVLYWQASAVGVAPITVEGGRVTIPVEIDGKALTGVIDTAAMTTSIKVAVAEKVLGLTMGSAEAPVTTPGNYSRTTGSFRMGTLGLRNIKVAIEPNVGMMQASAPADQARVRSLAAQLALEKPEVRIGMDLLRKLHLYMAFGEKKLYITPASAKPAATTTAAPAN